MASGAGIGRRGFVGMGIVGGAAIAAGSLPADAALRPEENASSNGAIAAVSGSAEDGTVSVVHGGHEFSVLPVGFPPQWEFRAGDLVYLDLGRSEVIPYVRHIPEGSALSLQAINTDPDAERPFTAVDPALVNRPL